MEEKMNRFRLFAMMLVVALTLSSVAFVGA